MAFTLSDLLIAVNRKLGNLEEYIATGGSTTTVVSTNLGDIYGDDDLSGATIFVLRDAGGAAAAPEKEYQPVSAYVQSTNTISTGTFSSAVGSGDLFGIAKSIYPLNTMVSLANDAIEELGLIPLVDTTTLVTADSKTEYTQSLAWKQPAPIRIDMQTNTGDADDNQWSELIGWNYVPAAAGATGLIEFQESLPAGYYLRVWYRDVHPRLTVYSSVINEAIPRPLLQAVLVEKALEYQNRRTNGTDQFLLQSWQDARQAKKDAMGMFKFAKPKRNPKLFSWSN